MTKYSLSIILVALSVALLQAKDSPEATVNAGDYLDQGNYCAQIIRDGINANNYGSDYKIEKTELDHSQTIELKMAKGGEYRCCS